MLPRPAQSVASETLARAIGIATITTTASPSTTATESSSTRDGLEHEAQPGGRSSSTRGSRATRDVYYRATMNGLPTGTVTFLFTDVEGSTRLWEQHPEAARAALAQHDALIELLAEQHGGQVVRPRGEG